MSEEKMTINEYLLFHLSHAEHLMFIMFTPFILRQENTTLMRALMWLYLLFFGVLRFFILCFLLFYYIRFLLLFNFRLYYFSGF